MDIASLKLVSASEKGAELDLLSPFNGESTGITFDVMGFDAPEMIAAAREFDREQSGKGDKQEQDEVMRLRRAHLATAAVKGWSNFGVGTDSEPYSKARAREIFFDPEYQWIPEQVCRFGAARRNFMPKPKTDA